MTATTVMQCAGSERCRRPAGWVVREEAGYLSLHQSSYGKPHYCKQHAEQERERRRAEMTDEERRHRYEVMRQRVDALGEFSGAVAKLERFTWMVERLDPGFALTVRVALDEAGLYGDAPQRLRRLSDALYQAARENIPGAVEGSQK